MTFPSNPDNAPLLKVIPFFYKYEHFPSRYVYSKGRRGFLICIWNCSYRFLWVHYVGANP